MKRRSPFRRSARQNSLLNMQGDNAEIVISDEIGFFGIRAEDVGRALAQIGTVDAIDVRLFSPGGDVFEGMEIFSLLRDHPAEIRIHIGALAASIAAVIAMSGDEIHIASNAFLMIHHPFTFMFGNAAALRKEADLLDKLGGSIEIVLAERSENTQDRVAEWMDAETWFTGAEAVEQGFADHLVSAAPTDRVAVPFDLSVFNRAPEALQRAAPPSPTPRDLESLLRDAGLTHRAAKTVVAQIRDGTLDTGGRAPAPRDAERRAAEHHRATRAALESLITTIT